MVKYIIKELVNTDIRGAKSVCVNADQFMENLTEELRKNFLVENVNIKYDGGVTNDEYWLEVAKRDNDLNKSINREFSGFENKLRNRLKEENLHCFAQLGLKSYWFGIHRRSDKAKYHTRFNHSIGVMKVAVNGKVKVYQLWENKSVPPRGKKLVPMRVELSYHHLPVDQNV